MVADSTRFVDGDGDPVNAFTESPAYSTELAAAGTVVIGVVTTLVGTVWGANLSLPRLTNETPDGVLSGFTWRPFGTSHLAIPYPVTALLDATFVGDLGKVVALSTGRPAFTGLRSVTHGFLGPTAPFVSRGSLVFDGGGRGGLSAASVTARTFQFGGGATVSFQAGTALTATGGPRLVTVPPDTLRKLTTLNLYTGSVVDASIRQNGGVLHAFSNGPDVARITGDWDLGSGAGASLDLARLVDHVAYEMVHVDGVARLAGALEVTGRPSIPIGTVYPLITTGGGVQGTFDSVTLPPGFVLSYGPTSVSVTVTS